MGNIAHGVTLSCPVYHPCKKCLYGCSGKPQSYTYKALEADISESRMSRIVNRVAMQEHERRHLARVLGINFEEPSDEDSTAQ